jgi:hypothetical protein
MAAKETENSRIRKKSPVSFVVPLQLPIVTKLTSMITEKQKYFNLPDPFLQRRQRKMTLDQGGIYLWLAHF